MPATLIEVLPYDPVGAAVVTLRATTDDDPRVCALNGQSWFPVLMKPGTFGLDLFDASFPGFASSPTAKVELDLSVFPDAARYSWGERPVRLWAAEPGTAWPWPQLFDGLVQAATVKDGRLTLTLRVNDAWLDRPVLGSYAGSGGAEGPAALRGAPKPLALGAPRYVAPQLVDTVNNVWQFHGAGSARAVVAALDRLVRYPASAGNFTSFANLVAASIPAGQFGTCLAEGLVRFGAPPAGPLTLIVEGDNGSADGWVRRAGALIKRIALLAGATTGQLDLANLTALDTAAPYNLSLYVTAQTTARELIARVAASVNGLAMVNLLGQLQVILPQIGTPTLTLAADGTAEPQVTGLELLETGAPWWRTQLSGDTCWRPHQPGEFFDPGSGGGAGPPGTSSATVTIYQRAVSAPAAPSVDATYTFATGAITGLNNGWSASIPVGTDPIWTRQAAAAGTGATDTITAAEWSAAAILAQNGAAGAAGANSAPVLIYQRATAAPAAPSVDATYTFATGAITGLNNGWSATIPGGTNPIWTRTAIASGTGATDAITSAEWSAAQILAQNGATGAAGTNSAPVLIYQRAATAPAVPSATATYTFSSGAIAGLNNGWGATIPAGTLPLWVSRAVAAGTGTTDTIATGEWSAPAVLSENGSGVLPIYRRSATLPATPAASAAVPASWFGSSGAVPTGADPIWISIGTRTAAEANWTWGVPTRFEAVNLIATGDQAAAVTLGTSASLSFKLAPGAARSIEATWRATLTGTNTLTVPMEFRIGTGAWTAFGTSVPDSGNAGDTVYTTSSGTVTNTGSVVQEIQVRATGTRSSGANTPTTDTVASWVRG